MSNRAWMPLHIADYLQDTGHLSALEHGAYLLLIMHYWKDGCLPPDEGMIRRIAKLSPSEWADSREVLAALFLDGWKHKRIDGELAKADAIIAKRRASAEHMHSKRTANAEQVQSTCSDTRVPTFDQVPTSPTSGEVRRARATKMPADYEPDLTVAIAHGLSIEEARQEVAKMRDWSLSAPGTKGHKSDWPAAWRNWCRRRAEERKRSQGPPGQPAAPRNAGELAMMRLNGTTSHEPTQQDNGRLGSSDGDRQTQGTGISRRFAIQSDIIGRTG